MKSKPQLLVIDTNTSMLRLLSSMLSDDYEIITRRNPLDAYAWLQDGHFPALTIIDDQAANMVEFSLVKNLQISGLYRNMPVVLMSSVEPHERRSRGEAGVQAYMQKPFNPSTLKATIDRLITPNTNHAA
jgi:two-component system chemotaxis response regulator CheY